MFIRYTLRGKAEDDQFLMPLKLFMGRVPPSFEKYFMTPLMELRRREWTHPVNASNQGVQSMCYMEDVLGEFNVPLGSSPCQTVHLFEDESVVDKGVQKYMNKMYPELDASFAMIDLYDCPNQTLCKEGIEDLVAKIKTDKIPVVLVTANGTQTGTDERLHFSEILVAILVLELGGTFILKLKDVIDYGTITYLRLLCSLFEEVHLCRRDDQLPTSEIYVVCLDYKGSRLSYLVEFLPGGNEELKWKSTNMLAWKFMRNSNYFNSRVQSAVTLLSKSDEVSN